MTRAIRVLHLEDSPSDAEIIRTKLKAAGLACDILVARRKESFEAALAGEPFDLIISDYNLPGYDGVTALKQVLAVQPNVPVILVSGTVVEEQAVNCLHMGATDYLLKDRLERLGPAVRRALEEAEKERTRREAEAAVVRLAAIVDSSDDAIFSVAVDGTVLTCNAAAERLYGYPASDIVGHNRLLFVPSERRAELVAVMARAARGETGEALDTRRVRKDGSMIDVSVVTSPIKDAKGDVRSVSIIARDITGRRKTEADLRAERDRAQRYLDAAEVILLDLDLEGRIVLVNRYACALLGWPCEELLGRDWIDWCVPARMRAEVRTNFQELLAGGAPIVVGSILTKSGEERLIEWRNRLLRDDEGHVVGAFTCGIDVTERNRVAEALSKAEERIRFALESSNIGIWDADYLTGTVQWSEILEAQYGLQPGKFAGTSEAFVECIHPDDRESVLATIGQAMASGTDFTMVHRSIRPDGSVRWLNGAGRVQLGMNGEPVRGVGISMDVTERHTLEMQYQQAQKMEAIGQLAGGVAHDFNNLLTVILGNCELIQDPLDPDHQRQGDLAEIQKAGQIAAGLTRQLLAFSRKEIVEPRLLDLNAVVAEMRPMLRRLIREDVELVLNLRPEPARVRADRGQLEQIVMNLSVNARDAMPDGGTLTIEVGRVTLDARYAKMHLAVIPGPYVVLTMTDTGSGMTLDVQSRLFEPFFTTKAAGKGTGLGLASVHGIVTQSKGSIDVSSTLGVGTAFKVYFPGADGAEIVVAAPPAGVRSRPATATILVVEDAEGLRLLTTRWLERSGHTVLVAANAEEAIRIFDANPAINLVLTDVVMPGDSGPSLIKQLVERRPALKVIYMSGYIDDAIVHHGVLEPGIAFLHKPFTSDALGEKIREVLER